MSWSITQRFASKEEAIRFVCRKEDSTKDVHTGIANAIARALRSLPALEPGSKIQLHTSGHVKPVKPTEATVRIEISFTT